MDFIAPELVPVFKRHGLHDFETLWNLPLTPLDHANKSRGGFSNAYRLQLNDEHGAKISYILKKQNNHLTRRYLKPWQKIPTFEREWHNSIYLEEPVIQFCYFAKRGARAIIISRELTDFISLDKLSGQNLSRMDKNKLIFNIAKNLASIHHAGFVHKSFYAKHIFVSPQKNFKVITIDLEKSRFYWPVLRTTRDLTSLLQSLRMHILCSQTDCLRFLLYYFGVTDLTPQVKKYWHMVAKRLNKRARSA